MNLLRAKAIENETERKKLSERSAKSITRYIVNVDTEEVLDTISASSVAEAIEKYRNSKWYKLDDCLYAISGSAKYEPEFKQKLIDDFGY